jgi:hypothetical protein
MLSKRVHCLVATCAALSLSQSLPASARDAQVGSWIIIETRDQISDKQNILAGTVSVDGRSYFSIRCNNGRPQSLLELPRYKFNRGDAFRILERINDGEVVKGSASALGGNGLLGWGLSAHFSHF